jgi:hypothetical protein
MFTTDGRVGVREFSSGEIEARVVVTAGKAAT